jgi:hypothetical protein
MRTHYIVGLLDSGIQPHGTPITAEPAYGDELRLNMTWMDEQGRIISAGLSDLSGLASWRWYLSNGVVQDWHQGRKPTQASTEASTEESTQVSRKNKKCLIM